MICSHHTRTVAFLLVAFVAAASHAQATQQAAPAAPAAPATVGTEPFAPAATSGSSPVTVTVARSYETNASVALPSSSLLADVPNAGSVTEPVLVIPGKPMDAQAIDQAVEDLSVMSRIIEKNAFAQEGTLDAFGDMGAYNAYRASTWNTLGPGLLFPVLARAKPMYLGGYGAVFFIQVSYPLLPPPEAPKEQPAGQEDSVWAEAKRSVLEPKVQPLFPHAKAEAAEPYDREKVDAVRNSLVAVMKHAANIRVLEPAEWVTIVVQGPAAAAARDAQDSSKTTGRAVAQAAGRTVMTLRATKADVDSYAKGQLNRELFEQRLQIVTY